MEYYRLEVTLKYHLAQPFVIKRSYMRLCGTLSKSSEWLFLLKAVPFLYWDENSPGAIHTHCPFSLPCVSLWTEPPSSYKGRLCWYCSTGMGFTGRKDPAAFIFPHRPGSAALRSSLCLSPGPAPVCFIFLELWGPE